MTTSLLSDCRFYGADLHAFVVMSNHIHFLANVPQTMDVSTFVQRLKTNSSKLIHPTLQAAQHAQLSEQQGLNQRVMWQRGFRSWPITEADTFDQKINYIEQNPIRAHLVTLPEEYKWSSLWLIARDVVDEHGDLELTNALSYYEAGDPQHGAC